MTQASYDRSTHTMSPLKIEIILWYHVRKGDYRDGDFSAPAVRGALDEFIGAGLLRPRNHLDDVHKEGSYVLTEGGTLLVHRLCSTPWPQLKWSY